MSDRSGNVLVPTIVPINLDSNVGATWSSPSWFIDPSNDYGTRPPHLVDSNGSSPAAPLLSWEQLVRRLEESGVIARIGLVETGQSLAEGYPSPPTMTVIGWDPAFDEPGTTIEIRSATSPASGTFHMSTAVPPKPRDRSNDLTLWEWLLIE